MRKCSDGATSARELHRSAQVRLAKRVSKLLKVLLRVAERGACRLI